MTKVWMAVDASPGENGQGRSASIGAAWYGTDDAIHVLVVRNDLGIMWVPDAIGELTRQRTVTALYADPVGPIGAIMPDIERKAQARIEVVDLRTMVAACARFHQAVIDGTVKHRNQDVLSAAVEGAAKRIVSDGWAIKRRTSTADVSPLVVAVLAHWGAAIEKNVSSGILYPGAT